MEKELIDKRQLFDILCATNQTEIKDKKFESLQLSLQSSKMRGAKTFINCEFNGGGIFTHIEISGDLIFDNCVFNASEDEEYKFETISGGNLTFRYDNEFNCRLGLINLNNSSTEIGGQFSNEIYISGGSCTLSFRGPGGELISNFKNITLINSNNFKSIFFRDLKQIGIVRFSKKVSDILNFAQGEYDTIQFQNTFDLKELKFGSLQNNSKFSANSISLPDLNLTGKIEFLNSEILKIDLSSFNNISGNVLFKDAIIYDMDLSSFYMQEGSVRFQNIEFKESFKAVQSNFQKAQFVGVNFYNAKLYLDWSLLSEAFYSNVVWPKDYLVYPNLVNKKYAWRVIKQLFPALFKGKRHLKNEEHIELKVQREIYRQLKAISIKNVNNIDTLIFYKNEMRVYWIDMRFKKEISTGDQFLLFLNRYLSNFGQSYLRPFLWILFGQTVFCILIWHFEADKWCGDGTNCKLDFVKGIAEYFTWLNPIFKTPEYWTSKSVIISFFMRIYNGFFIYHFIKATRKFGKV